MPDDKSKRRSNGVKIAALAAFAVLLVGAVLFFRYAGIGQTALWSLSDGGRRLFPLVSAAVLIDSINPCAFSILILTIAFLLSLGRTRRSITAIGLTYILGIFVIYILIGLGILQTLHLFNTPHFMAKVGAFLLIAWGAIGLINEIFPSFPIKLRIPAKAHHKMAELMEKASLPAAFFLGALVGICEFPCTGGPYLLVLGLLHDQATYLKGLAYLIYYNLIFILPLAVILLIASNRVFLEKVRAWKREETGKMRIIGSLAMVALGLIIIAI